MFPCLKAGAMLRFERPDLVRRYWKGVLWSPSHFAASCSGAPRRPSQGAHGTAENTFVVKEPYISALKGGVLRPHG
jgi:hypothetical protein